MKGIYTNINGKVYRINQDCKAPITDVKNVRSNSMSVKEDNMSKTTVADIYLTDFVRATAKTNKENYADLVTFLTDSKVTSIDFLENAFFVSVDYTVRNAEDKEIEHSVVIKPVHVKDFIYPLGVTEENECVYRRFKRLDMYIEWMLMNKLPYGIMCKKNPRTYLSINDITFWQDKTPNDDEHQSIYSQPFNRHMCTCTIDSSLENKIPVFSTKSSGIVLQEIVNSYQPRVIGLTLEMDLTDFIVVYDTAKIDEILEANKNAEDPSNHGNIDGNGNCGNNCSNCNCSNGTNTSGNSGDNTGSNTGNTEPSIGNTDPVTTITYEKSNESTVGAILVVADNINEDSFDPETMIKLSDIKVYIDDITIGEYVIKQEVTNTTNL